MQQEKKVKNQTKAHFSQKVGDKLELIIFILVQPDSILW